MLVLPSKPIDNRENEEADYDLLAVTISSLSITNQRRKTILNIVPNGFPATKVSAIRDLGDSAVVEYVQVTTIHIHCICCPINNADQNPAGP